MSTIHSFWFQFKIFFFSFVFQVQWRLTLTLTIWYEWIILIELFKIFLIQNFILIQFQFKLIPIHGLRITLLAESIAKAYSFATVWGTLNPLLAYNELHYSKDRLSVYGASFGSSPCWCSLHSILMLIQLWILLIQSIYNESNVFIDFTN